MKIAFFGLILVFLERLLFENPEYFTKKLYHYEYHYHCHYYYNYYYYYRRKSNIPLMTLTAPSNILLDSSNSITSALHDQESKRVVKMKSLPQMTLMAG